MNIKMNLKINATEALEHAERTAFEAATYAHYLERHAQGKLQNSGEDPGRIEDLMWRQANSEYGVLLFNASWWAWQARAGLQATNHGVRADGMPLSETERWLRRSMCLQWEEGAYFDDGEANSGGNGGIDWMRATLPEMMARTERVMLDRYKKSSNTLPIDGG